MKRKHQNDHIKAIKKNREKIKEVDKRNQIIIITETFLHEILGLKRSLPVIMLFLINKIELVQKELFKIKGYFKNNEKEDYKHAGIFEKLIEDKDNFVDLSVSINAVPQSLFICMVSYFDSFLGKLIFEILQQKPDILKGCNLGLSNKEVLEFKKVNKGELIRTIINKESRAASSNGNILAKVKWIEDKLNFKIFKDDDMFFKRVQEIVYRRNSLVHEGGKISKEYLNLVKN